MAEPTKEELELMMRMILGKKYDPDFDPRKLGKREDAYVGPSSDWDPSDKGELRPDFIWKEKLQKAQEEAGPALEGSFPFLSMIPARKGVQAGRALNSKFYKESATLPLQPTKFVPDPSKKYFTHGVLKTPRVKKMGNIKDIRRSIEKHGLVFRQRPGFIRPTMTPIGEGKAAAQGMKDAIKNNPWVKNTDITYVIELPESLNEMTKKGMIPKFDPAKLPMEIRPRGGPKSNMPTHVLPPSYIKGYLINGKFYKF